MQRLPSFFLALVFFAFSPAWAAKPNIVLFFIDDLGWMDLGCQGSEVYETPNIDALAATGMRFTNGYAACAVCSPSRAAVVTGQYPSRVGITDWIRARFQGGAGAADTPFDQGWAGPSKNGVVCPKNPFFLPLEHLTLAEVLKGEGYATCYVGKWHLGFDPYYPEHQGFDANFGGCDYGQPPSYFDPYTNKRLSQGIPGLPGRKEGEYLTDREADEACGFIREHHDGPFFVQLSTYTVHTPIQAKPDLLEKYKEVEGLHPTRAAYATMVEGLDIAVGKVMGTVEELGLAGETIVVFTSDNGGLDGGGKPTECAPLREGKGHPYEGGVRVPFIVRWPGVTEEGIVSDVPVMGIDLFPTLVTAAGAALPEGHVVDGADLRPVLSGGGMAARPLLWHFPHYRGKILPYSMVRVGGWKLLKRYDGDVEFELYNLDDDLGEAKDLAPSMPERVEELDGVLQGLLAETGSRVPHRPGDEG